MRYSAQKLAQTTEVQTTFHWDVILAGPPFARLAEPLAMRMTSSTLPEPEHNVLKVIAHGHTFPGPGTVKRDGEITLTAYESVGAEIILPCKEWFRNIWGTEEGDVTGKQMVPHESLFGTAQIILLDKQEQRTTQTHTLNRCILQGFTAGGELQSGQEGDQDYFKPTLTLAYAWANWGQGSAKNL